MYFLITYLKHVNKLSAKLVSDFFCCKDVMRVLHVYCCHVPCKHVICFDNRDLK